MVRAKFKAQQTTTEPLTKSRNKRKKKTDRRLKNPWGEKKSAALFLLEKKSTADKLWSLSTPKVLKRKLLTRSRQSPNNSRLLRVGRSAAHSPRSQSGPKTKKQMQTQVRQTLSKKPRRNKKTWTTAGTASKESLVIASTTMKVKRIAFNLGSSGLATQSPPGSVLTDLLKTQHQWSSATSSEMFSDL